MSFTLLFSSYLFHFFPLPCSHIFSWCLLSLAVAWVAMSWKYWFLPSLLFLLCCLLYNPSSSSFSTFSSFVPVLHLWHFTVSQFFFPWDLVLTSHCGFAAWPGLSIYGIGQVLRGTGKGDAPNAQDIINKHINIFIFYYCIHNWTQKKQKQFSYLWFRCKTHTIVNNNKQMECGPRVLCNLRSWLLSQIWQVSFSDWNTLLGY